MAMQANSRYLHTTMIKRKGWTPRVFDVRERYTFNVDNCQVYTFIEGDTLDGLAHKFYGNTHLRWAIMEANTQYRTEFDIQPGDQLLIPDYEEVVNLVNV